MGVWMSVGVGVWGDPYKHTHACACMGPPWRQPFAISIHVYFSVMHVHTHVCTCMNVGACGEHT